jgi:hypothetical protein
MSMTKTLHPDEKIKAGTLGGRMFKLGLLAGLALLVASYVFGHLEDDHLRRWQFGYLTAWVFAWSLATGALFFVLIHHLTRARWSTVMRRIAENVSRTFPWLAVLSLGWLLPMLLWDNHELYFWSFVGDLPHSAPKDGGMWQGHEAYHHVHGKLGWLNGGFFAARLMLYMAIYTGIAWYFSKWSRAQDDSGDPAISEKLRIASGPGMLIFALTTVFVGFDVVMSLAPEWYSTIYSVNLFGGAMIGTYAFLGLLTRAIQQSGRLTRSITVEHYHDVGKLLFGFTFFWAYTAFSQFMLIWYANIPEEVVFYRYRMFSDWQTLSIIVILCCWAIPYVLLLSRWTKRILPIFMVLCAWQLIFHYVDLYWNIMPNITWWTNPETQINHGPLTGPLSDHQYQFAISDVLSLLGMTLVFIAAIGRQMRGNLVPTKDPNLGASLAFENY